MTAPNRRTTRCHRGLGVFLALALAQSIAACADRSSEQWLVVGASAPTAAEIAVKAATLRKRSGTPGLVFQVRDCGETRTLFAWAAEQHPTQDLAKVAVERWKAKVPDAYAKRCTVKPQSLLWLGVDAVDASIAHVPASAVNWDEGDRVSAAVAVDASHTVVISRYFDPAPEDPLEGRRARVSLARADKSVVKLADSCHDAAAFTLAGQRIAFQCSSEQAGDQVLHNVLVVDAGGRMLQQVPRCQRPRFDAKSVLSCDAEEVDAQGQLRLRAQRVTESVTAR